MTESSKTSELREELEKTKLELAQVRSSLEGKVKERTQQLEVAKQEWERTFDSIGEPVVLLDPNYKILRANLALARIVKGNIRHIVGHHCYKILTGREEPCEQCPLPQTLKTKESATVELRHQGGTPIYQLRSFPMSLDPPQLVHTYHDITEEHEMQQKLRQSEKLSNLGLLAGRVAHEINNPLAGILAQTQLLLMDFESEQETYSSLKDIETAALRCRKIVRDLLDFSRQAPTDRKGTHDLNQLLHQVVEWYEVIPATKPIELIIELAPDLPPLRMDPAKLQSVFLNLLGNAKSAVPAPDTIRLQTYLDNKEIVTRVQDNGGGIPESIQAKIFEPFFTTKPKGLGTGLGLYIVKEIIDEHEGQIILSSKEGEGTTFEVRVPVG